MRKLRRIWQNPSWTGHYFTEGLEQAPGEVGFDDPGIGFPEGFGPPGLFTGEQTSVVMAILLRIHPIRVIGSKMQPQANRNER